MVKGKVNRLFDESVMPAKNATVIYSLFDKNDECIWVGQTKDLKNRIYQHLLSGKEVEGFNYFECKKSEANDKEALTIVDLQPQLNKTLPSNSDFCSTIELRKAIESKIIESCEDIPVVFRGQKTRNKVAYIKTENMVRLLIAIEDEIKKIAEEG